MKYGKLSKMVFVDADVTFTTNDLAFFQIFLPVIFDFNVLHFHRFGLNLIYTKIENKSG